MGRRTEGMAGECSFAPEEVLWWSAYLIVEFLSLRSHCI